MKMNDENYTGYLILVIFVEPCLEVGVDEIGGKHNIIILYYIILTL